MPTVLWSSLFNSVNSSTDADPGLPRRLLRHLFLPQHLGMGGRLLDVGCGTGELTRFLDLLSVETVGIDASPAMIHAARQAAPHIDYFCADPDQSLPVPDHYFEFVLARDLAAHQHNLLSFAAHATTANLLATLRPGGELVLLAREDHDGGPHDDWHLPNCLSLHLAAFPGACRVVYLNDWLTPPVAWRWIVEHQPRPGYLTATLKIPNQPIGRQQWFDYAVIAGRLADRTCCSWCQSHGENTESNRDAA
ncbi:MAG: class I SAM-dependent methyltransferase [Planctomycetales bacterium]|nr:class I SAM-dependent methyltransferase [Planctomycetales bacterium]